MLQVVWADSDGDGDRARDGHDRHLVPALWILSRAAYFRDQPWPFWFRLTSHLRQVFRQLRFRLYLKQKPRLPDVNRLGAFLLLNVLLACSLFLVFGCGLGFGFSRLLLRRSFGGAL